MHSFNIRLDLSSVMFCDEHHARYGSVEEGAEKNPANPLSLHKVSQV
jgi:hypothetical protein